MFRELKKMFGKKNKTKYNNEKIIVDGIKFDSKREYGRWFELKMRERLGEITDLQRQVEFPLSINGKPLLSKAKRPLKYIADHSYVEKGILHVEDVKGFQTEASKLKIAIFEAIYNIKVEIIK